MNETLQQVIEAASQYQKPEFSFADLMTFLFFDPISDPISGPFIVIIAVVFVSAFLSAWFPRAPILNFFGSNAITILPALGILGTFVGVLVAVSNFDTSPDGIVQSLGVIMQGLKIAFSTSIFGLAGSIVLRFVSRNSSEGVTEIGPEEILSEIQKGHAEAREHSRALISAISGDSDSSLNNQLKLMRQDLTDFAKTVAEANTTAFIEALKQAIADFNKNLTEQFGENFKRLNEAVGKLLIWQENNKNDMDLLRRKLDEFTDAAKSTSESLQQIERASASIPENVSGLANILSALDAQMQDAAEAALVEVFETKVREGSKAQAAIVVMSADGAVRAIERDEGDATVHCSTLLHGVSCMHGGGARYSLIVFFERDDGMESHADFERDDGAVQSHAESAV